MKFEIKNRWSGNVMFSCDLSAEISGKSYELQLGFAVKKAIETNANLAGAYLAGAYLAGAYLAGANLEGSYLASANLAGANLAGANLAGANLAGAYLADAYLAGANLANANLSSARLADANLANAYLTGAYLAGTNLANANLAGAKNAEVAIAKTRILPEGSLIGWKKLQNGIIAKLRIPEEAKRSHAFGRKCRAEYADVIELIGGDVGVSEYDGKTKYKIGKRVYPDSFSENWQEECTHGIHFFITKEEAQEYN